MELTREQIINEKAGRRLDAWVAEYVMGWTDIEKPMHAAGGFGTPYRGMPPGLRRRDDRETPLRWSESMEVIDEVIQAMLDKDESFGLSHDYTSVDDRYICCFGPDGSNQGEAETVPLAICKAALLASLAIKLSSPAGESATPPTVG